MARQYSDNEKALALAELAAQGGNVSATARVLNIPERTLARWRESVREPDSYLATLADEKKEPLADMYQQIAERAAGLLLHGDSLERASAQQQALVSAVAVDKARLLRGEPQGFVEHRMQLNLAALTDDEIRLLQRLTAKALPVDDGSIIDADYDEG